VVMWKINCKYSKVDTSRGDIHSEKVKKKKSMCISCELKTVRILSVCPKNGCYSTQT